MSYVGNPIDTRNTFQSLVGKRFNGDGSTTAFTLDVAPSSTLDIEVFVGNVRQDPNSAYTLSGTTLTFTGAPPSGTNNIYVVHQAKSVGTIDVPTGGVAAGSLASSVLTGQTDIGGAIADADLFLVDDGAGGTLRKVAASRIKTYTAATPLAGIDDQSSSNDDQLTITDTAVIINEDSDDVDFRVESNGNANMMIVDGGSNFVAIGKDNGTTSNVGNYFSPTSENHFTVPASTVAIFNREDNGSGQSFDGTVVAFRANNSEQGTIAISGSTTSYNAFSGAHWGRLSDNTAPTILRGTVIESIATMIDWYIIKMTNSDGYEFHEEIALPNGKSVGDTISHTAKDGVTYNGVIEKQINEQLPMTKISDTEDSKAVYGVFNSWDNEPDDGINDMLVTALGAFIVRIHKDETVAIGDLLSSKGDGTAKKQADDIFRASTIAKVTSTEKTYTYDDGSYCVPCTLHCG